MKRRDARGIRRCSVVWINCPIKSKEQQRRERTESEGISRFPILLYILCRDGNNMSLIGRVYSCFVDLGNLSMKAVFTFEKQCHKVFETQRAAFCDF